MNRLDACLGSLRLAHRKAIAAYLVAGDPEPAATPHLMRALVDGGASIIELGLPFTDPEADGPVIQRGHQRALAAGTTPPIVFDIVRRFRRTDPATPVVVMGYVNLVERIGVGRFARMLADAGIDGVIMTNLPPEEGEELSAALAGVDVRLIYLVAPTTSDARARLIGAAASGFLYYVSLKGVTGASHLVAEAVNARVKSLRSLCDLPIMVGFGIRDASTARAVATEADGVVIGAAVVERIAQAARESTSAAPALTSWLRDVRHALDAG